MRFEPTFRSVRMRPADGPSNGSETLSRIQSLADYTIAMLESSFRKRQGIDGQSLGNGTAFSAVAPSKRPVFAAHRSNIREWSCPQARIAGHLTFHPLVRFREHCGFLSARSALPSSVTPLLHTAG